MDKEKNYQEMTNVQDQQTIIPEEFPEGSYGAAIGEEAKVENKSTPWKKNQRTASAFTYEFRRQHENVPRQYPGAHPTHDE
ncbi:hypothetical protein NLX67_00615 [Domibacillus sp. A3M-37]|uniref:hypothetical protein n=1 Tax=Domibacillus TaxID=1433999 RepID=UPI000617D4B7|nr:MULTISPECIES: hypothetical protein [Domibacillus]MCP3760897.1 hypothetical protein [Domibacillus sp. A3M-37]